MKKNTKNVSDFCLVPKKIILPAVIAGITFFFSPVPEYNDNDSFYNKESSTELQVKDAILSEVSDISQTFDAAFKENCKNLDVAYPVFKKMLPMVCSLPIEEGYADYGNMSGNIHFNMFLKDNLRLTIDKNIDTSDDKVAFSLSIDNEMLALDEMMLSQVIDIVKKLLS